MKPAEIESISVKRIIKNAKSASNTDSIIFKTAMGMSSHEISIETSNDGFATISAPSSGGFSIKVTPYHGTRENILTGNISAVDGPFITRFSVTAKKISVQPSGLPAGFRFKAILVSKDM